MTSYPLRQAFIDFLKADPDHPIDYYDIYQCALARFGRTVYGDTLISAGAWSLTIRNTSSETGEDIVSVISVDDSMPLTTASGNLTYRDAYEALEQSNQDDSP